MPTIVVRPELLEALARNAELSKKSVDDVVDEALSRYVRDIEDEKLDGEIAAY